MSEPENMTLVLLREMRAEQAATRDELLREIKAAEARTIERVEAIGKRVEQLHVNGMKGLAGFVGHRSLTERAFGSVDKQLSDHEARLGVLEAVP